MKVLTSQLKAEKREDVRALLALAIGAQGQRASRGFLGDGRVGWVSWGRREALVGVGLKGNQQYNFSGSVYKGKPRVKKELWAATAFVFDRDCGQETLLTVMVCLLWYKTVQRQVGRKADIRGFAHGIVLFSSKIPVWVPSFRECAVVNTPFTCNQPLCNGDNPLKSLKARCPNTIIRLWQFGVPTIGKTK